MQNQRQQQRIKWYQSRFKTAHNGNTRVSGYRCEGDIIKE